MAVVQKGNKQLHVPDEKVKSMLQNGFAEVDEKTGKILREAKTDELKALKKENKELEKENASLKAELEALKKGGQQ